MWSIVSKTTDDAVVAVDVAVVVVVVVANAVAVVEWKETIVVAVVGETRTGVAVVD